jgi:hypothetical protein
MNLRTIAGLLVAAAAVTGCDRAPLNKIPFDKLPFIGKKEPPPARPGTPAAQDTAVLAADSTAADSLPPDTMTPVPEPEPVQVAATRSPLVDEPWFPSDTGTIVPGMTRDDVVAVWGAPVAERQEQTWTYLYFRNGCEVTCGTFDVVFLESNQVVDAIVRGQGHTYMGTSSSPPDRPAEATPPPDTAPMSSGVEE